MNTKEVLISTNEGAFYAPFPVMRHVERLLADLRDANNRVQATVRECERLQEQRDELADVLLGFENAYNGGDQQDYQDAKYHYERAVAVLKKVGAL